MRYGVIAPIIAGLDERYPNKTAFYTEISAKGLMGPDGTLHHYAPATIEKWYLDYQNHGFEGLVPKGRSDAGMSRKLDEELQERIRYFKTNYPRMSAAAIYRQLKSDGSVINGQVSESTISRFVNRLQSELRQTPNKDMRRYERPHINEVWCGDSSAGLLSSNTTNPPILPSVDCPHRTVSFQNRSRSADFLKKTSVKISFWRLNAGYLLTV